MVFVSIWEGALLGIGMKQQGLLLGRLKNSLISYSIVNLRIASK